MCNKVIYYYIKRLKTQKAPLFSVFALCAICKNHGAKDGQKALLFREIARSRHIVTPTRNNVISRTDFEFLKFPEHRDKKGFTPLILAATAGHDKVVEILLGHGADIEAQSERTKDTPLSLACSGGRYEVRAVRT